MENEEKGKNPLGDNPFGENPFGDAFVGDRTFGGGFGYQDEAQDQGGDEKVCPHCGTAMEGDDTYCMICGMSVSPVLKRDYQKATEENDLSGHNGGAGGYGGGTYGGPGVRTYGDSSRTRTVSRGKRQSGILLPAIVICLIGIAALAGLMFFRNAKKEAEVETTTHLHKAIDIMMSGKGQVGHREEDIVLYAKGDVVTRIVLTYDWDRGTGIHAGPSETFRSSLIKHSFIKYDRVTTEESIVETVDYMDLNVEENLKVMVENDFLEFDKGEKLTPSGDHLSLKQAIQRLKAMGFSVQE